MELYKKGRKMKHFKIVYIFGFDGTPHNIAYETAKNEQEAKNNLLEKIIFLHDDMILSVEEI
jgi:hypothetical protein